MTGAGERRVLTWLLALASLGLGCSSRLSEDPGDPSDPLTAPLPPVASNQPALVPFTAWSPAAAGRRVKTLLTGMGLSDEEHQHLAVTASAAESLPTMIDAWLALPGAKEVLRSFFRQAFQQSDVPSVDQLHQQFVVAAWDWFGLHQRYNIQASLDDMWGRTVLDIVENDRPFTEVLTTTTYMMNVPTMVLLAFWDAAPTDDAGQPVDVDNWLKEAFPSQRFTRQSTRSIPASASTSPLSADFLNFYEPVPPFLPLNPTWCQQPIQFDWTNCVRGGAGEDCVFQAYEGVGNLPRNVLRHLFGARFFCDPFPMDRADARFPPDTVDADRGGLFSSRDWNEWRPVRVRAPRGQERPTLFMDLQALRQTDELVLRTEHSGFMTMPAFLYKWPTNPSNQHRVTLNQALIVALGHTFAPNSDAAAPQVRDAATLHAQPGTTCFSCHQVLDPMTDFFRQAYNLAGGRQTSVGAAQVPRQAAFALAGATARNGFGVADLGKAMADHPLFATAWTQKICHFANAFACDETDPEFVRVASAFASSGHNFRVLLRELLSSPLVTWERPTQSTLASGTQVSIARKENFCAMMSQRLGWPDACQLRGYGIYGDNTAGVSPYFLTLRALANTLPQAAAARGVRTPLMPSLPNLFAISATDQLCRQWSLALVDPEADHLAAPPGASLPVAPAWSSSAPDAAIAAMVAGALSLPASDPRAAAAGALLREHHGMALGAGASATDALRSTFVVACQNATATSIGM